MLKREPYIDIVIGPQAYHKINDLILNQYKNKKIDETDFDTVTKFNYFDDIKNENSKISAFLTIQEGCDKFCHFCVVPYTRGPEYSRSVKEILEECRVVVGNGAREITLLGQNVNAYNFEGKKLSNLIYEISKILEEFERKVLINFSKTRLILVMGNIKVVSILINSSFPDYESVIPKDNNQTMTVDCKSFSETIDRVSTISDDKLRTVKFQILNGSCTVSSFGNDKSIGTETLNVDFNGSQISINFNARYILDVLGIIKSGKVKFHFSEKITWLPTSLIFTLTHVLTLTDCLIFSCFSGGAQHTKKPPPPAPNNLPPNAPWLKAILYNFELEKRELEDYYSNGITSTIIIEGDKIIGISDPRLDDYSSAGSSAD